MAHVDAGKTTFSERLLYLSSAINAMGEVEEGLATMDYLPEEQRRGITIEAGMAGFVWKNHHVTFVDTPGHVDFSNEVDTVLPEVEGALLILCGRSGLEAQTFEMWRKIKSHRVRPIIFINKFDVGSIAYKPVLNQITENLNVKPVVLTLPLYNGQRLVGIVDVLNESALYLSSDNPRHFYLEAVPDSIMEAFLAARKTLVDAATEKDETLMEMCLAGQNPGPGRLIAGLKKTLQSGSWVPTYLGSALKCIGVRQVMNGINFFLPPPSIPTKSNPAFKVMRLRWHPEMGRMHLIKLYSRLNTAKPAIKRLYTIQAESLSKTASLSPGNLAAAILKARWSGVKPGDTVRLDGSILPSRSHFFSCKPLLQTRIESISSDKYGDTQNAIKKLLATEPSIHLEVERETGIWILSTMGEVQLEVFFERLEKRFGCRVVAGPPEVRLVERLNRPLKNLSHTGETGNIRITVSMDIFPLPEDGTPSFVNTSYLDEKIYRGLFQSLLEQVCLRGVRGYGILDNIRIELKNVESAVKSPPLPLLSKCLRDCFFLGISQGDVDIYEPLMKLQVEVPQKYCGTVIADLNARGGKISKMEAADKKMMIQFQIPLKRMFGYSTLLRSLSKGQGMYTMVHERYGKIE